MSDGSQDATMFAFNVDAEVRLARIGRRGIPVTRVDNVLCQPEGVAALGFAQAYAEDSSNLYPGLRAPLPAGFSTAWRGWLTSILQRGGVLSGAQAVYQDASFFSVVTTSSRALLPIQCIPHYDSTDPDLFAAVLYLCASRFAGTSFYRHRKTGYELITEANRENYQLALDDDLRLHGVPRREYANGDSVLFEAIFANELRFNSAIIYPGGTLHAANIRAGFERPVDKSEWRLTVTSLLRFTPPGR
jgi:hypothetical protein